MNENLSGRRTINKKIWNNHAIDMTCKYFKRQVSRILIAIEIQSMLCMRYDDDKEIKLCHWVLLYVQFLVLNPLFPQIGYLMTKTTRMTNFWFFFQSRIFTRQYMHSTFFTTHHFYLYAAGFVNILLQQRVWTKQYSNGSLDPTMSFSYNG